VTRPTLSIVAPVYNEARILEELVARCRGAARQCGVPFELVIVDDASNDDTPTLLASAVSDPSVRSCRLSSNVGQFRATQAGLRCARGQWVVVLDGDLQDPPEHIPRLVEALSAAPPSVVAVLAVKAQRADPLAFMIGQFVFHRLQHILSGIAWPRGAGSYCIMRDTVARRVARAELGRANLAAIVAVAARAVGGALATVSYEKGPRYDRSGRVGWPGLVAEALESLAATGALSRLLALLAVGLAASGLVAGGWLVVSGVLLGASVVAALSAWWVSQHAAHSLAKVRAAEGSD